MTWSFLKFVLTLTVVGLLLIISILGVDNPITFNEGLPEDSLQAKAASFTLVAVLAAFTAALPKGYGLMAAPTSVAAKLSGFASAGLAGWYALYAATGHSPRPYLEEVGTIGIFFVILAAGIIILLYSIYGLGVFLKVTALLTAKGILSVSNRIAPMSQWVSNKARRR